jgi:hypothetical protein
MPQSFRERMSQGVAHVYVSQLRRTWEEIEHGVEVRRAHVEHLQTNFMSSMPFSVVSYFIYNRFENILIFCHHNH